MKKKSYHWQPELSTAIIYWSCTFGILFISLILSLEYTRPYLVSNLVLVIFFVFALLGLRRTIQVRTNELVIKTVIPFLDKKISYETISKIVYGEKSVEIFSNQFSGDAKLIIMKKKTKNAFIDALQKDENLQVMIEEDPTLGLTKKG